MDVITPVLKEEMNYKNMNKDRRHEHDDHREYSDTCDRVDGCL